MATFAGLLELEGPCGHTVRDFPPGVLYAARAAVPPVLFLPFVQDLLNWCSPDYNERIDLHGIQFWTSVMRYPDDLPQDVPEALTQQHLVAFRRQIWPRKQSVAELEGYTCFPVCCRLHHLDPRLRQLLDALFAHESELTAVLQHLLDTGARNLSGAANVLEKVLTGERPSMTIPDDPRVHGLLRQAVDALRSMLAQQEQARSGSSSRDKAAATDELRSDGGQPPGTLQHCPPVRRGSGICRDCASSSSSSSSSGSSAEGVTSEQSPLQDSGTQKPAAPPGSADTAEPAVSPTSVAACVLRRRRRG